MQCTGLKDKNGKLIYEGDIVRVSGYGAKDYISQIYFENSDATFSVLNWNDRDWFYHSQKAMEILGNIHENIKLLENSNEY